MTMLVMNMGRLIARGMPLKMGCSNRLEIKVFAKKTVLNPYTVFDSKL